MQANELNLPKDLIHASMQVVACRTRLIMELGCLNENEKRLAIDDMIKRQMRLLELDDGGVNLSSEAESVDP